MMKNKNEALLTPNSNKKVSFAFRNVLPSSQDHQISCAIRARPLEESEALNQGITLDSDQNTVLVENLDLFTHNIIEFDRVFDDKASHTHVYNETVAPFVENLLSGKNVCVLSYGQHDTAKNSTINSGLSTEKGCPTLFGECVADVLDLIKVDSGSDRQYTTSLTCIELFNDAVRDLLNPDCEKPIRITERIDAPFISQSQNYLVKSMDDVHVLLQYSSQNRNPKSHVLHVFRVSTLNITTNTTYSGALCWVDLACPERTAKSETIHLEAVRSVNKSLSTLGSMLTSLQSRSKKKPSHWRDSKLTRALCQIIDEHTKIWLIIHISLAEEYNAESVSSIHYGQRVMMTHAKMDRNDLEEADSAIEESMESVDEVSGNESSTESISPQKKELVRGDKQKEKITNHISSPSRHSIQEQLQEQQNLIEMYEKNISEDYNQKQRCQLEMLHNISQILQKHHIVDIASILLPSQTIANQVVSNIEEVVAQLLEQLIDQDTTIQQLITQIDSHVIEELELDLRKSKRSERFYAAVAEFSTAMPNSPLSLINCSGRTAYRELKLVSETESRRIQSLENQLNDQTLIRFDLENTNRQLEKSVASLSSENNRLKQRMANLEKQLMSYSGFDVHHSTHRPFIQPNFLEEDERRARVLSELEKLASQVLSPEPTIENEVNSPRNNETPSPSWKSPPHSTTTLGTPTKQASLKSLRKAPSNSPVNT